MHRNGVPLVRIQKLLRHARLETTLAYLYDEENDLLSSVDVIGQVLTGFKPPEPVRSAEGRGESVSYPEAPRHEPGRPERGRQAEYRPHRRGGRSGRGYEHQHS
jgi:hypothetical protein